MKNQEITSFTNPDYLAPISGCFDQSYNITVDGQTHEFDACIFDFDGVIADTEKLHFSSWCQVFASAGTNLTPQEYLPLKSTGRNNILAFAEKKLERQFTDVQKCELNQIKDAAFARLTADIDDGNLIAGAREFLQLLKSGNVKTGVASSAKTTKGLIEKLQLSDLFGAVIDGNTGLPKKPSPALFSAAINALGEKPQKCLIFEDSIAGIEAALSAGATVIAVGGIKDSRALLCIDDFTYLI